MKNKHLISSFPVLFMAMVFLHSCDKNEDLVNHAPVSKKLWKIKRNDGDSTLFAYLATGQLHKVIYGGSIPAITFSYDPFNRIEVISYGAGIKNRFIYENNRLKLTENFQGLDKVSENIFGYTGDKITTNTLYVKYDSANGVSVYRPDFKVTYTYNSLGDVTHLVVYKKQVNGTQFYKYSEKVIEQYDNAKNPLGMLYYLSLLTIYDIQGGKNILREKTYDALGNIEETTVNTFQYDEARNPVSGISRLTPTGGISFNITSTYYYK